jgi:hypothetical protein
MGTGDIPIANWSMVVRVVSRLLTLIQKRLWAGMISNSWSFGVSAAPRLPRRVEKSSTADMVTLKCRFFGFFCAP